jgi:hypothetical protein
MYKMPKRSGPRTKTGSYYSKGKKRGRPLKKMIAQQIRKASETKSVFTSIDEFPVLAKEEKTLDPFSLVAHGNKGNERIGNQIQPTSLKVRAWFRPRSLKTDEADQFSSAIYSRVVIVRQKPQVRVVSGTPAPVTLANTEIFRKSGSLTGGITNDFADIFHNFNSQLGTVIYDKKFFISGSEYANNIKEIKFNYRFPKTARMNFTDNSSYPHEMVHMYIINRKVDDDVDTSPKTIEYSGNVEFYYKDL